MMVDTRLLTTNYDSLSAINDIFRNTSTLRTALQLNSGILTNVI